MSVFEQQALRLAATVIPASRVCLYRVGADLEPHSHIVLGGDNRWVGLYTQRYRALDPIHPRYFAQERRSVFRLSDAVCDSRQLEDYRQGFQQRLGVAFKAEVFLRSRSGEIVAGLRFARSAILGDFDGDALDALEALQPVLARAWRTIQFEDAMAEAAAGLTERETEVLHWLLEGVSNKEICRRLGLALPTVKCHVKNVLRKCGASTRAELTAGLYRTTGSPRPN